MPGIEEMVEAGQTPCCANAIARREIIASSYLNSTMPGQPSRKMAAQSRIAASSQVEREGRSVFSITYPFGRMIEVTSDALDRLMSGVGTWGAGQEIKRMGEHWQENFEILMDGFRATGQVYNQCV